MTDTQLFKFVLVTAIGDHVIHESIDMTAATAEAIRLASQPDQLEPVDCQLHLNGELHYEFDFENEVWRKPTI